MKPSLAIVYPQWSQVVKSLLAKATSVDYRLPTRTKDLPPVHMQLVSRSMDGRPHGKATGYNRLPIRLSREQLGVRGVSTLTRLGAEKK
jgi:hypothetical protein